ncbi:MAG: DnaD domain protein, partial [Clostridiales bacterium]|nr:DnaD domain protein [Clostridiales bacterium]
GLIIGDSILPDIFTVKYCQDLSRDAIVLYLWLNMTDPAKGYTQEEMWALRILPEADCDKAAAELVSHGLLNRKDDRFFLEDIKALEVEEYVRSAMAKGTGTDGLALSSDEEQRNTLALSISKTFYSGKMYYNFYRLIDKCLYEYKFDSRVCYRLFEEGYKYRKQRSFYEMEKLASEWYNKGYTTIDKLDEYIDLTERIDKLTKLVGKLTRRHLNGMDIERIEKWARDFGATEDLVNYAFRVNEYRGKITPKAVEDTLVKWFDAGAFSLEKAEKLEEEEHNENKINSARRKSRSKSAWKTGAEAGIEPEDKKQEQSAPAKGSEVPSDVLGMFGGGDEDD